MKHIWLLPLVLIVAYCAILFRPFFFGGKLPIPADTVVGLYHPWRDFYAGEYPSGIPYKNFLITDPVRQQYLWRQLAISDLKQGTIPAWNPYNFSGTPLLANFQTAVFYPLNIFYLLGDFATIWSAQVLLQLLLGGIFMYLFLRHLNLGWEAAMLGIMAWIGSGFVTSWLEWNTLVQTAIWLPLALLAIDKIFSAKRRMLWVGIYTLSLTASFLAGHLQIFFYVLVAANLYILFRAWQTKKYLTLLLFFISYLLFSILVSPQLLPTVSFIKESARNLDQANWNRPEWFLPWQNLVQFVAPDFFGNPATLNYTGVFSYQEFVAYIGLMPLTLSVFALFFCKDTRVKFFGTLTLILFLFILPTPLAKLPFIWQLPLISSAQPTRLIFLIDFFLAILAAIGLDKFLGLKDKKVLVINTGFFTALILFFVWARANGRLVSLHNLYLPVGLAAAFEAILILFWKLGSCKRWLTGAILLLVFFDLLRFTIKFEAFSDRSYLFPETKVTSFLQEQAKKDIFRITTADDKIMPPNFSIAYRLQTVSGYDPLYLSRYGKLIAAIESNGFAQATNFNRIIVPKNHSSKLFDLLNVKYLLTLADVSSPRYKLVFQEGQTRIYENTTVLPRAFFVAKTTDVSSPEEGLQKMFSPGFDPAKVAVVETSVGQNGWSVGRANIVKYEPNEVIVETDNTQEGFLVLTDAYYPSWHAEINHQPQKVFVTDYTFRGVVVPAGHQLVRFWTGIF